MRMVRECTGSIVDSVAGRKVHIAYGLIALKIDPEQSVAQLVLMKSRESSVLGSCVASQPASSTTPTLGTVSFDAQCETWGLTADTPPQFSLPRSVPAANWPGVRVTVEIHLRAR